MTTFNDLEFKPQSHGLGGVRARTEFPNGYGASIIRGPHTYGGPELYELAVLKDGDLCYDTPVTDDVLGWLTPEDVTAKLAEIEALPATQAA